MEVTFPFVLKYGHTIIVTASSEGDTLSWGVTTPQSDDAIVIMNQIRLEYLDIEDMAWERIAAREARIKEERASA